MTSQSLLLSLTKGVRKIVFNRPEKKNAFNPDIYRGLAEVLNTDAKNDNVVATVITGAGEYYSSGNDLKSAMLEGGTTDLAKNLIQAFIDYPKILIAVVNGPAIGIGATSAALCDVVYASEKAWFDTPFVRLGLCAEAGSSYTFPSILGRSKASELLLLNKRLSAQEAYHFGFVSQVIPHKDLNNFIGSLDQYGSLPVNIVKINKELVMRDLRETLTKRNETEMESLKVCLESEEFAQATLSFMQRKSKL